MEHERVAKLEVRMDAAETSLKLIWPRMTKLEQWQQRIMGGLAVIIALLGWGLFQWVLKYRPPAG